MKKAFDYLNEHAIPYEFHDYKKSGITIDKLKQWSVQIGWEKLLNKQGSTWRALGDETKNSITSEKKALHLLSEKTSVIKRPVIENDAEIIVIGFDNALYDSIHWKQ